MEENLDNVVMSKEKESETKSKKTKKKFNRHYKNMTPAYKKGDRISVKHGTVKFSDGKRIPSWGINYKWYVANCRVYFVEVSATPDGKPCGEFKVSDVVKVG